MTSEQFDEWMRELRSDKYTKIRGSMGQDGCYCALGVYLNECGKERSRFEKFLDIKPGSFAYEKIADKNDNTALSLPEIADYIETNFRSTFVKDQR